MVRRAHISAASKSCALQAPVILIITVVEAFAPLEEENRHLYENLNALEELLSCTQNNTLPLPVPTPEPLGSKFNSLPPAELTPLFKELKIGEPTTFSGKPSEFYLLLSQCKLYIRKKTLTFRINKTRVAFIISHLCSGPAQWAHTPQI